MMPGNHLTILLMIVTTGVLCVLEGSNKCPELYRRFSSFHTYCRPANETCTIVKHGVNEEDKHSILKWHNFYRSKIATGQEQRAGIMPPAANMLEMIWDDELAAIAQKHSDTCNYAHDCPNCRTIQSFSVGQNIGLLTSNMIENLLKPDWGKFVTDLYDEVDYFNNGLIRSYVPGPVGPSQYGHFTQLVWASTWRVGCGWTLFEDKNLHSSFFSCNYGPMGNMKDEEVYVEGPPCSMCPANTCCGETCQNYKITAEYNGLCRIIDESKPPINANHQTDTYAFYCNFQGQSDCQIEFGGKPWMMTRTPGGNWISNILKPGERTTATFLNHFKVKDRLCLDLIARTGPIVDGGISSGVGRSTVHSEQFTQIYGLQHEEFKDRQQFVIYNYRLLLPPRQTFQLWYSFDFSVPPGSEEQYIEISEVSVKIC